MNGWINSGLPVATVAAVVVGLIPMWLKTRAAQKPQLLPARIRRRPPQG